MKSPFPDLADGVSAHIGPDGPKRRQILDGASQVFRAAGFDGASMGEIARAAGVSKGTLYVYFDSKEALFEALVLSEKDGQAEALFRVDDTDPDVRSVLRGLGLSFLEMMTRPQHVALVRMVIGAIDKFPRVGQVFFQAGHGHGVPRLARYLDGQVAAGRLTIGDTTKAAEQFLNLCSSGIFKRTLFAVIATPKRADLVACVDDALDMFMATYASGASRRAAATRA